ncbi:alpha/beta hydrolase [Synechocystis sp. FACHB-383]|uniref:alpha/beta hydrolase n=1 Tax=Synechocystis sp. FACHB-383 TaxID=2692864 RepID=UPI001682FB53|nr:alpha/beta hydrolase [Synechocystis sp. FACHB-383]MBD2655140.1 alpha/beta hydrolase [Synechocystis sp. FACHB-383]
MINLSQKSLLTLGFGLLSLFPISPISAAEEIKFSIAPFGDFNISVDSLETFAQDGKITPEFNFYAKHLTPEELTKFRALLNKSFPLSSIEAFEFFNTSFGKEIVRQLSLAINSPPDQSQPFLKGAIISAAVNPNGFKIIDVLKNYDSPTLYLDLKTVRNTINEADYLYQTADRLFAWLDRQALAETSPNSSIDLSDLSQPGKTTWTSETLTIPKPNQDPLTAFVYLPQGLAQPAPVIVIAPGLNSDFQALSYVAKHLASHGFATVGIDFPESDNERMLDALKGLDTFPNPNAWMNQPKDVSLVLDTLEQKMQSDPNWQGKLDVKNVGILGHSLGGYTATAIGGARVQWPDVLKKCATLDDPNQINLNPSLLWQCKGIEGAPPVENLQDPRIKAVIAINPVTNPAFGNEGVNQLSVPMMFIAGSSDIFAPPLSQQIVPFAALNKQDKYLLLVKNSTHLSFDQGTDQLPGFIVGPGQELAYDYLKSISLAFFNLYLNQQQEFKPYLTDTAVQKMGKEPLPLHLIKSLTQEQLNEAIQPTN